MTKGSIVRWVRAPVLVLGIAFLAGHPAPPSQAQETLADRLRFSGYGEVHYNNPGPGARLDPDAASEADVHRFVLGWSYEFTPEIRMDAEVDFEHAAQEIELEYAHLDYDLSSSLSLRVGSVLMPVGALNEFHEPPHFYSVERPYVETYVIPTTWQEIGIGVVGRSRGGFAYRAYVVTGLEALGFNAVEGLRDGRSHGSESRAEDLALVIRTEYAFPSGLSFGASGYKGGADQGDAALRPVDVRMATADARYRRGALDLRGAVAATWIDGADSLGTFLGETVGNTLLGWYAEAAYDLLRSGGKRSLYFFGRYEDLDTNESVPSGFTRDEGAERRVITAGASFLPVEKVSFKADFEHWEDGAGVQLNRFNLGMGFMF